MSTGPFTRTNRNTPQRNLNKSQQPTQASFTPSQPTEEKNNGGYVYRPPTRIVRSNVNAVKQVMTNEEKTQGKKQEQSKPLKHNKFEQPPVQKPASFVRKPATQTIKETTVRTTTVTTEVTEIKEETKPTAVKSVSKLPIVRTNDQSSTSNLRTPKKQDKQQTPKLEQTPKPITSPYTRTTKLTIQPKTQTKPQTTPLKNPLEQFTTDPTKSIPNLQIKKPSPFYAYPKKITKRQSEKQSETQGDVKNEQVDEQKSSTPKFSDQEKQEAPQMFSSAYSYRNKNATSQVSVQSSQSSTALKAAYQSVTHAPVEKVVQTQKPASTIVDTPVKSPAKTPLSHASRYSNKMETPVKQQAKFEPQILKQSVKRSPLLVFVLHRLYIQKMTSHMYQYIEYSKSIKQTKTNEKIHLYFQRSLTRFIKVYEQNVLVRSSFNLIKSILSKLVKSDMTKSTDPKIANQLVTNRNQAFGKVLENILSSVLMELRFALTKLKSNLNEHKIQHFKRQIGTKILSRIEVKKMKQTFSLMYNWTHTKHKLKVWKLSRCSQINVNYKKLFLVQAMAKIVSYKLKQLTAQTKAPQSKQLSSRPSVSKLSQKPAVQVVEEPQANVQLKQKVAQLESRLLQVQQKNAEIPKQSDLRRTVQQLKQQKAQLSQEISNRKQRSGQLKQRLQTLMARVSHQSLSSLSEQRKQHEQPTLTLLHEIYMKIHKQAEQQCTSEQSLTSLCTIHRVEQNCEKEIVAKWLTIKQNLSLKHWINLYEGNYVEQAADEGLVGQRRLANRQMEEENDLVKKFIRSYVKERYMWEEVKDYVAAVISQ